MPAPFCWGDSESRLSGDLYSQSLIRPESRLDRGSGLFHETRLRGAYDVLESDRNLLKLDFGAYLLAEWGKDRFEQAVPQNIAVSPYLGARISQKYSDSNDRDHSWMASLTAAFEGRFREPVSEGARATGIKGWDPRGVISAGLWWMRKADAHLSPFLDFYGDAVYAPKFSNTFLTTLILRGGLRHSHAHFFLDGFTEIFAQNAPSLELGTKRSEARLGVGLGRFLSGGSVQVRFWHGIPMDGDQDRRPRNEALLVVGAEL